MVKARARRFVAALSCAALALACTLGLAACGSQDSTSEQSGGSGTLRVGVRADVSGFGYLNEDTGKYYGLEIDIAEELVSRLGYAQAEYVTVTPDTRKEMLLNGEIDCVIACYSVSDSRKENFDFSPTYYTDESVVIVEDSSHIEGIEQMDGLTFGTMAGSNTSPQLVQKLAEMGFTDGEALSQTEGTTELGDTVTYTFDNFTLIQWETYQQLSDALEAGLVDAAALDGSIAKTYMNQDRTILAFDVYEQEYAVATQKDSELSAQVYETIQGMLDDGTIDSLTDKWD